MSEVAADLIKKYLQKYGKDDDLAVRKTAAATLWQTGDLENQQAAEAIWKELGVHQEEIDELKHDFDPNDKH